MRVTTVRAKLMVATGLAAVVVGALSGCGGAGSGTDQTADLAKGTVTASDRTDGSTPTITKAQFIVKGDAICTRTASQISESLGKASTELTAGGKPMTRAGEEKLVKTITAPKVRKMATELGKLPLPHGAEKEATALIKGFAKAAVRVEKNPGSALGNSPLAAPAAKAEAFGFEACSLI